MLKPEEVGELRVGNTVIIDTRSREEFKEGFVPGSLYIGLDGNFEDCIFNLVQVNTPILLIVPSGKSIEIETQLRSLGYAAIFGFYEGQVSDLEEFFNETDMIIDVEADELALDIPYDQNLTVLDVRKPALFAEGHVKDAINMPLAEMTDMAVVAQVEETQNVYVHSQTGYQSVIAISILKRQGYHNVRNVTGGWQAIQGQPGIKVEKDPQLLN